MANPLNYKVLQERRIDREKCKKQVVAKAALRHLEAIGNSLGKKGALPRNVRKLDDAATPVNFQFEQLRVTAQLYTVI